MISLGPLLDAPGLKPRCGRRQRRTQAKPFSYGPARRIASSNSPSPRGINRRPAIGIYRGTAREVELRSAEMSLGGGAVNIDGYARPARRWASTRCWCKAPANTIIPWDVSAPSLSIRPRRSSPSMALGSWFRKLPQPKSLISKRCSVLVNSSQSVDAGILVLPVDSLRRSSFGPQRLMKGKRDGAIGSSSAPTRA